MKQTAWHTKHMAWQFARKKVLTTQYTLDIFLLLIIIIFI